MLKAFEITPGIMYIYSFASFNVNALKLCFYFSIPRKPVVKIVLEDSLGAKSESLFHAKCYNNQTDNVCARKEWRTLFYVTKTKVERS